MSTRYIKHIPLILDIDGVEKKIGELTSDGRHKETLKLLYDFSLDPSINVRVGFESDKIGDPKSIIFFLDSATTVNNSSKEVIEKNIDNVEENPIGYLEV